MLLSELKNSAKIKILKINIENELWKYGIFDKTEVYFVRSVYKNVIVQFDNHQYVIMKDLAKRIEVEFV